MAAMMSWVFVSLTTKAPLLRPITTVRSGWDWARDEGGVTPRRSQATPVTDLTAEIAELTRTLKAPALRESVDRLAERARAESWTHEEYLVAACKVRSPPATPTAAKAGSGPRGSQPGRARRPSTSTTPEVCPAT
jgi:hypothetical protein